MINHDDQMLMASHENINIWMILNFVILFIPGFLENQYSVFEPLPMFSINNHDASSKYWWSLLIYI